jgi:hypothetical protein
LPDEKADSRNLAMARHDGELTVLDVSSDAGPGRAN